MQLPQSLSSPFIRRRTTRAAVLAALSVTAAVAQTPQTAWSGPIAANPRPAALNGFAMAAAQPSQFAPQGLVMLFGGFDGTRLSSDTWLLDLNSTPPTWALLPQIGQVPSPREGHVLAFDPTVNAFVLHGGRTTSVPGAIGHGNLVLADVWHFNPSNMAWQPIVLAPGLGSPPLHDHAMVFDGRRNQLMIFGGHQNFVNGPLLGDELHLNRTTFSAPAWIINAGGIPSPAGRARHAMAFDEVRQRVIMFGGLVQQGGGLVPTAEFFELDSLAPSNAWTPIAANPPLFATFGAEMTYDAARGRTVFFGNAAGSSSAPVMEYDGAFHTRAPAPGLQTSGRGFVFDPFSRRCAFFGGGVGPTHTYAPATTSLLERFGATAVSNGALCMFATPRPQTPGLPRLDKETSLEWQIGQTRNLEISNLPAQNEVAFVLASFGEALPAIPVSGAPGCFQLIANPTSTLPMILTNSAPSVLQGITIPANLSLAGVPVFHQALITDASSPRGFALSNGTRLVAGTL